MPAQTTATVPWTDDTQLAAEALETAARCYRHAVISDESDELPPSYWLAQAEDELGRAARFISNATATRMAELAERAA
ncbi:MAG: hypothetical protein JWQ48_2414 [Conexibacter sp.]|nr:hypothetical protein [Conexibacter sp.]